MFVLYYSIGYVLEIDFYKVYLILRWDKLGWIIRCIYGNNFVLFEKFAKIICD